jgi:8-oxo-dGTP pyrophosphatase MutT (NUDIX family)
MASECSIWGTRRVPRIAHSLANRYRLAGMQRVGAAAFYSPTVSTPAPASPTVARPAATVVLLRDAPQPGPGGASVQVFLQRRVAGMAFAGGMTVFPGGGVDTGDRPDPGLWRGPGADWWARQFGCAPDEAGPLVVAAVRETFEECGVLLAGPGAVDPAARDDLVGRRRTMNDVLGAAALPLQADLLAPWARWVTPEAEPRRYDTAFFVAAVPEGQEADARTTEAVEATWWYPADALAGALRGELRLMPPTQHTLEEIAGYADVAGVLAAARSRVVRVHRPVVHRDGRRVVVTVPGDPALRFDVGGLL